MIGVLLKPLPPAADCGTASLNYTDMQACSITVFKMIPTWAFGIAFYQARINRRPKQQQQMQQ
jgi:hypothetical protein